MGGRVAYGRRYKGDAMLETANRADALLEEGDMAGAEVWHRILNMRSNGTGDETSARGIHAIAEACLSESIFEYRGSDTSLTFNNLRNSDREIVVEIRKHIDALWRIYQPFADRDFVAEFPRRPEERYWEMYLGCALLDMGMSLRRSDPGPDLLIEHEFGRIWIEAIAPTAGDTNSADRVPDLIPINEGGSAQTVPVEKIILRYTAALEEKRSKFRAYREKGLVSNDDTCVIAISGAHLAPRGGYGDTIPYIVRAVLPFGNQYVSLDKKTLEIVGSGYTLQENIKKASGTAIPTTAFLNGDYDAIAAVIFGPSGIGNTPQRLGIDLITVHNTRSKHRLPLGYLNRGFEYWLVESEASSELKFRQHNSEAEQTKPAEDETVHEEDCS
jgi:hypothetical protein